MHRNFTPLAITAALLGMLACNGRDDDEQPPRFQVVPATDTSPWVGGEPVQGGASGLGGDSSLSVRRAGYPRGPYGSGNPALGDVVPDVLFEGFIAPGPDEEAHESDFGRVSLAELRKGPERYLIVHVSALWCSPCLLAAEDLSLRNEEVVAAGARSIELLIDGGTAGFDPTREELELWSASGDLRIPTVLAAREETRNVFPNRERVFIIELDTMTVVWRAEGFYEDTTITAEAVNALLRSNPE